MGSPACDSRWAKLLLSKHYLVIRPGACRHGRKRRPSADDHWENVMKKITATAITAVLIAAFASGAGASERHHRRHVQQPGVSTGDARDAYGYYPGWGRPMVPSYGVYPGLIYGGATSAPAGR
jgi:hypothetical protein